MKTVLHVSKYYYPDLGGIEAVAKYLAEGLDRVNNVVVCFSTDGHYHEDVVNGVTVYRIAVSFSLMNQDVCFSYASRLKTIFNRHQPDVVLVHCPNPFVYPLVMHFAPRPVKMVLLWHSDILAKGVMYHLVRPFEKAILRRADLILSTSPNYIPFSPIDAYTDKVRVLQNGITLANFLPQPGDDERIAAIRERYAGRKIILNVGRHAAYKGLDRLIEAESMVKTPHVLLIGGRGVMTERLKRQAEGRDSVVFLGRLSDDDLRCHLQAADVCGFSSVTKAEAFGIALAEAMYCGCVPVCFTLEGSGVNWVSLGGETGMEVPLNDVKAYAAAIDRLLTDPQLHDRLAQAARKRVCEMFTIDAAVAEARRIFDEL